MSEVDGGGGGGRGAGGRCVGGGAAFSAACSELSEGSKGSEWWKVASEWSSAAECSWAFLRSSAAELWPAAAAAPAAATAAAKELLVVAPEELVAVTEFVLERPVSSGQQEQWPVHKHISLKAFTKNWKSLLFHTVLNSDLVIRNSLLKAFLYNRKHFDKN